MRRIDYSNQEFGFPYPLIIYSLCLKAGVAGKKQVVIRKPMDPITNKMVEWYKIKVLEEEEEEEEEEPALNEPVLGLQAYIAHCSHYLLGGYQHTQEYMHRQAQYGTTTFEQMNEHISRWDINQENQAQFPPYPQYFYYSYQALLELI